MGFLLSELKREKKKKKEEGEEGEEVNLPPNHSFKQFTGVVIFYLQPKREPSFSFTSVFSVYLLYLCEPLIDFKDFCISRGI